MPNIKGTFSVFEVWTAEDNWWCACNSKKERDEWIHAIEVVQNFKPRVTDFRKRYAYLEDLENISNLTENARQYIAERNTRQQNKQLSPFDAYTLRMEVTMRKQNPDFGMGAKQLMFDWVSGGWSEGRDKYSPQGYVVAQAITDCVAKKGITELAFKKGDKIELMSWPSSVKKQYDWVGRVKGVEGSFNVSWPKKYVDPLPGKWLHQAWLLDRIVEISKEFQNFLGPQEVSYFKNQVTSIMFHYDSTLPKNGWKYRVVNGILHCFGNMVDQSQKIDLKPLTNALAEDGFEVERRLEVYSKWEQGWKSEVRRTLGVDSVDFVISTKEVVNSPRLNPKQRADLIYYLYVCVPRGIVKALGELAQDKTLSQKLKSLSKIHCMFKTSSETIGKRYIWFGPNDIMYVSVGFPEANTCQDVPLQAPFNPTEGLALEFHSDLFFLAYSLLATVTRDKNLDKKKIEKNLKDVATYRDRLYVHKVTAREFRADNPIFQTSLYQNYVGTNEFAL